MNETLEYLSKIIKEQKLLKSIEIILVNDGSSDKTLDLLVKYSKEYNNEQ